MAQKMEAEQRKHTEIAQNIAKRKGLWNFKGEKKKAQAVHVFFFLLHSHSYP